MPQKSSKFILAVAGAVTLGLAGLAQAGDSGGSVSSQGAAIKSRGADSAHADLMRDWNYKAADQGKSVTLRTDPALNADLMRDWNAPASDPAPSGKAPHSRTADSAYDDLMRNWGG